jgi:hypothetical protein
MLPQQLAITKVGMLERVDESFCRRLHYCIDNSGGHFEHSVMFIDYSDYFMRIFTDYSNFRRHFFIILGMGDSLGSV